MSTDNLNLHNDKMIDIPVDDSSITNVNLDLSLSSSPVQLSDNEPDKPIPPTEFLDIIDEPALPVEVFLNETKEIVTPLEVSLEVCLEVSLDENEEHIQSAHISHDDVKVTVSQLPQSTLFSSQPRNTANGTSHSTTSICNYRTSPKRIVGRIINKFTGQPVEGAQVTLKYDSHRKYTETSENGDFEFILSPKTRNAGINICKPGFYTRTICTYILKHNNQTIYLTPNN